MNNEQIENYGRAARLGLTFGIGVVLIVCMSYALQGCGDGTPIEEELPETAICDDGFVCIDTGFIDAMRRRCGRPTPECGEDELRTVIAGLRDDLRRTEEALRVAEDAVGACQDRLEEYSVRWRSIRRSYSLRMRTYRECRRALNDCTDQLPPEGSCCVGPDENYGEACHSQRPGDDD